MSSSNVYKDYTVMGKVVFFTTKHENVYIMLLEYKC